jgi:hypothetical protein
MPGFDSLEPGVDPLYPATQCTRSSLGYSDTLLGYLATNLMNADKSRLYKLPRGSTKLAYLPAFTFSIVSNLNMQS